MNKKDIRRYYLKTIKKMNRKKVLFVLLSLIIIFPIVGFFSYFFVIQPSVNFPKDTVFEIKKGQNVKGISEYLEKEKIINSAFYFRAYDYYQRKIKNEKANIKSGNYSFSQPLNIFEIYKRLESGESGIPLERITILEGDANFTIAKKLGEKFKKIDEEKFFELAKNHEGFLYPDTYSFSPYEINEQIVIDIMRDNFEEKAKKILKTISKSDISLNKIITMASLIEKEAGSVPYEIKRKVSGVLWQRLNIDMPLQVDAVFDYIYKEHLTRKLYSHLKIDDPYNTYIYKGLPPGPIGNPSVNSIYAALYPIETKNVYYLTGKDGIFYFSQTLDQHNYYKKTYISNYVKPEVKIEITENTENPDIVKN